MKTGMSVSLWAGVTRRIGGVGSVSAGAVNRQIPQKEFVTRCAEIQREAAAQCQNMKAVVAGLWKTEGFSTTFGKFRLDENTLNDPAIPRESLGITHVGYGAACTEFAHFDPAKLKHIFSTLCHPQYAPQAIEGVGSILRIYEPGLFKTMCGFMGLIPKGAPPGPDRTGFFASFLNAFSPEEQRLITHGYGRLVAFSNLSVDKAIGEALALPENRREPCTQGIAFAFTMMNSPAMPSILARSAFTAPGRTAAAFQNGLVYALVYCEWFAPGMLAAWKTVDRQEEKLIGMARAESAANLKRGYMLPFALENPL